MSEIRGQKGRIILSDIKPSEVFPLGRSRFADRDFCVAVSPLKREYVDYLWKEWTTVSKKEKIREKCLGRKDGWIRE
jgi:hypothetical protein